MLILVNDVVMGIFLLFFSGAFITLAVISSLNARTPVYASEPVRYNIQRFGAWVSAGIALTFILNGFFLLFHLERAAQLSFYLSLIVCGSGLAAFGPRYAKGEIQRISRNGRVSFRPMVAATICAIEALGLFLMVGGIGLALLSSGAALPDEVCGIILWIMAASGIACLGSMIAVLLLAV